MLKNNVFVDIGDLSCGCTDHVLGTIAKALSGEDGLSHDIWAHHDSPFVKTIIEHFSSRGLLQIDTVKTQLMAWIKGTHYVPNGMNVQGRPVLTPGRLDANELALVRIYLENLPPASFTAGDWSLLVDYLVSRYMPPSVAYTEAEWLTVRSTFMGKVQANVAAVTQQVADGLIAAMPLTIAAAKETFHPKVPVEAILEFGRERTAANITAINDATRTRIKRVILDHEEQRMLGATPPQGSLQTKLFDEFSTLNRDWRRIALTEVSENAGNGLIASLAPGSRVRRVEQYVGSCAFCQKIHGRIFTVVSPDKKDKNWETEVWAGKSNVGRSGAKKKRTDDGLVDRTEAEMWTVPAGPVHPHCRGIWEVLPEARPEDDPSFALWLDNHFAKHRRTQKEISETLRARLRGPVES